MLVQQGEGSGTPTEPHHTPSPEALSPSHTTHTSPTLPPVTTTSLPIVTQSDTPIVMQYTRRTRIAQSSVPLTVADQPASPLRDVSQREACPTDSGFIVDQDRATIDKPPPCPMIQHHGDDAPIKGRSMDEGEAATERISDDLEEMETVLTTIDASTVLASGVVDVPTGSGSNPTASTPAKENKARLVAQGYTQEEGIDYDEVFAHVARIEAIGLFLAYASFMSFTVYQMDVKSAFLYGTIDEEVYVMQPPGFQDPKFPAKVYKVKKAMCGLHQAPRAWYGTLSKYLLKNDFHSGTIDQTLFIRKQREDFILVQVYVDDIIFGSSNPQLCREFEAFMHDKFQMSAMGELNFFLGLQVLQKKDGIFLSQDKYVGDILKKFGYSDVRSSNTLMDKENPWGKEGTGKDVDLHLYRSMIGSLMYLTASRLDIMFAIHDCARHQVTPKECHLHAVKRIFRYLKGHLKLGFSMPCEALSKELSSSILCFLTLIPLTSKSVSEDVSEEELKGMMQLVPLEEVYVEALQQLDREDLHQLWTLVKETFSIKQATSDKEKEL
nr:putative ribonuclease H-like domain-containing protein [Tanacetum cinerariifolium]